MPNFPDPPNRRLAYDADGTVVTIYKAELGTIAGLSTGQKQAMNNESLDNYTSTNGGLNISHHLGFWFPGERDITDLFLAVALTNTSLAGIDWSDDATNPLDGTWTAVGFSQNSAGVIVPNYRSNFSAWVASGITALRLRYTGGQNNIIFQAVHLYGSRAAGDTSRQVALVDSGGNRLTKDFDYQDQPRGSTYKWKSGTLFNQASELYVKNFGATTANTVVVGQGALTGGMHNNIRISLDDITYTQTLTATIIAAGASYGPIFVRWTPPSNDTLGLQTMRTSVTVGSWS